MKDKKQKKTKYIFCNGWRPFRGRERDHGSFDRRNHEGEGL